MLKKLRLAGDLDYFQQVLFKKFKTGWDLEYSRQVVFKKLTLAGGLD